MVPPQYAGQPKLYVVHAWSMPFCEMVRQLVHALAPGKHDGAKGSGELQCRPRNSAQVSPFYFFTFRHSFWLITCFD